MKSDFSTKVTGGSFIAAGLMLLLGWILLPTHIGTYFQPQDFAAVHAQWSFWIWMYRIHIFGMVVTTMALVALGALLSESAARILVWPGVAMAGAGMMVSALATAFYYHFGAWGALDMDGESPETIRAFVESLRVSTEYVTCLVRRQIAIQGHAAGRCLLRELGQAGGGQIALGSLTVNPRRTFSESNYCLLLIQCQRHPDWSGFDVIGI